MLINVFIIFSHTFTLKNFIFYLFEIHIYIKITYFYFQLFQLLENQTSPPIVSVSYFLMYFVLLFLHDLFFIKMILRNNLPSFVDIVWGFDWYVDF